MSDVNYEDANLYDLAYLLDPTEETICAEVDPHLAKKVEDIEDLHNIYYYLCYGDIHKLLPHTKKVINSLFSDYLKTEDEKEWWQFKNFHNWFDSDLAASLTGAWLDSESPDKDAAWIIDSVPLDSDLSLRALKRLSQLYKKSRVASNVKSIERLFGNMTGDNVKEACGILAEATPAIAVSLLQRDDIQDEFTLAGLKALSKLKKQRDIDIKIDFNMLSNLGPKSRLDAMKQLLGMLTKYYNSRYNYGSRTQTMAASKMINPFKTLPTRSEIETFLFPCSLKYNDQVVELVKKYEQLTSQKGGE